MPYGAQLRMPACTAGATLHLRPRCCIPRAAVLAHARRRGALLVRSSAGDGSAPMMPEGEGPREVSLTRRVPGVGYTFMLAGALKIMTVGWIATGAPRECVRTVAGQYAQFFLIPVGLLLCFIAKRIVDEGLHESKRFMAVVLGLTAFAYVGLYNVLYRYEPKTWAAQQRLQASAAQQTSRSSPYAPGEAEGGLRNKFIIQRQLEGEYEPRTAAYYSRAPEMQMDEVDARVGGLPAGMVGTSEAERRVGGGAGARAGPRVGAGARRPAPSMYDTTPRIPGLEDSDF